MRLRWSIASGTTPKPKGDSMSKQVEAMPPQMEATPARIAKYEGAFRGGKFRDHAAVCSFRNDDASGQRGWGPMLQTSYSRIR